MSYKRFGECLKGSVTGEADRLGWDAVARAERTLALSEPLTSKVSLYRMLQWLLYGEDPERAFVVLLDSGRRCIRVDCIYRNGIRLFHSFENFTIQSAQQANAAYCLIACCHEDRVIRVLFDEMAPDAVRDRVLAWQEKANCRFLGFFIRNPAGLLHERCVADQDAWK